MLKGFAFASIRCDFIDRRFLLSRTVHMGMEIHIAGSRFTLGHPHSGGGGYVYTSNHGAIPRNSNVTDATGQSIGSVVNYAFTPSTGADVSLVRLRNGVTASRFIPWANANITTFRGATPDTGQTVWTVTRRGSMNVLVTQSSANADIFERGPDGIIRFRHTMRNLIQTNMSAQPGDSGGPLIHGTASVGTLFGGRIDEHGVPRQPTFFSPASSYTHVN